MYHKIQIELTYNTNRIEGSKLTEDETRFIFETNTIGIENKIINIDDIIETNNHFRCIDYIIQHSHIELSEKFIKKLHSLLKGNTSHSRTNWFVVGGYKKYENEVGGLETSRVCDVGQQMKNLLIDYNRRISTSFEDIIDFHYQFETIHPFQDGNGRVGRLIMFKECLKHNIIPFIIKDEMKLFYYRGLKEWKNEKGYLLDTCLSAQDTFEKYLEYFKIK